MKNWTSAPNGNATRVDLRKLRDFLVHTISREVETAQHQGQPARAIDEYVSEVYARVKVDLPETLRLQLFRDVIDHLVGYGPIQPLLDDPDITEVMVNTARMVYVERQGKLIKTRIVFESDEHLLKVIDKIILPLGRSIDHDHPTVDARLPDGSRVNAVIPPVAIDGPLLTIRKFNNDRLDLDRLINMGSLTQEMATFLRVCVEARLNIVISGGTGSGKTTLLNVLSSCIPEEERIITIEDAAELQLKQEHVARMETKPPNSDGVGIVTIRDLVRNALRMRPDRIVVGEVRGGEAIDMLQAMNTGHDGSLTTLHANSPRDALSRLETMALMSDLNLPLKVLREQIASAVDLIVQQARLADGTRKVTSITEVAGMEGDTIVMTDIFKFKQTGKSSGGEIEGTLEPTGIRPTFAPRLESKGHKLGTEIFGTGQFEDFGKTKNLRRW
jgi:pilus assembly protein CpaF